MSIPELPPFTPRLEGFRLDEFHHHSLELLAFPIEHNQQQLDLASFRVEPPPPPPDPALPLLPYIWYPKPIRAVRDWALGRLIPPKLDHFWGKTRHNEAQQVMRPLLAGGGPVEIRAEAGLGKTTLLAYIASHERTRQRFRRVWWFDEPTRVAQTLALALNVSHALTNPVDQFGLLRQALDDDILLVIDNLTPSEANQFRDLGCHLVLGIETPPEVLEEGETPPPDPEGTLTLRPLPRQDSLEMMMHACGLTDRNSLRGQMRAWMSHIAQLLAGHPLAIMVAGALFREDGLPMERLVELLSAKITPDTPNPSIALDISLNALPSDYQNLLIAFGSLPPTGASLEAVIGTAKLESELVAYRGLSFLRKRGFITHDSRLGSYYIAHRLVWERMAERQPKKIGENLQHWVLSIARRHREDAASIYRFQREILYTLDQAKTQHNTDFIHKLTLTLGAYLREYAPQYLDPDVPAPSLIGERARAATLVGNGLRLLEQGEFEASRTAFEEGLAETEKHGSDHEIAEALVAFARYFDHIGDYTMAITHLERAAKLVYDLKTEKSLHLIRIALAMVYRKQERYKDALAVLDEQVDTHAERARIYRATKQWDLMISALESAGDLSPYAKAEGYLQAGRYVEALESIIHTKDSDSAFLRATIHHLQDDLENAVRGYEMALEIVGKQSALRIEILIAIGKAYVMQGELEKAEKIFIQALEIYPTLAKPNELLRGKVLCISAALHLLKRDFEKAISVAKQALEALAKIEDGHQEKADTYRTLGRVYWLRPNKSSKSEEHSKQQALAAFEAEVNHAQSLPIRDEARIGIALHHLADAYQATEQLDRAIANYRRALTHKNDQADALSYFMTQLALHRALFKAKRFDQALEIGQMAMQHLSASPPADLQHIGYLICSQAHVFQEQGNGDQALRTLGRWLSILAGRSDALQDKRQQVVLLALNLAVRSLVANQRAVEAKPFAEMALNLAEQHFPSTSIAWSSRRDLGEVHLNLQEWQSTVNSLLPLLYDSVKNETFTYTLAHEYTAIANAHLGDLTASLQHFHIAYENHPIAHQKALILERIADIHLESRDAKTAIEYTRKALPLLDREKQTGDSARILTKLARLLTGANRYSDSIQIYEDALEMLRSLPDADPIHTARVYVSLASSHEAQGQYPQAAIAYRNALDTLESSRKSAPDDHRKILSRLAAIHVAMQNYNEAIALFLQARSETEMYGSSRELGLVLASLANTYQLAGNAEEALYVYEDALKLQPADENPRERAATLRGYGQVLSLVGHLAEARDAWTEALAITTDAPALEIALTYRAIAQAHRAQSNYEEAEKAFQDAIGYHQVGTPELAETWRLYGKTLTEAKRSSNAIHPLQQALDIEKGLSQQVNGRIVETLDLLAEAQEKSGHVGAAITCHHEALVYMDRNLQPSQTANRYRELGRLYTTIARWTEAHKALEEALTIEFNHKPRSDARIAQTLEMIAQAYRREGNLPKAAEAYKRMASYANLNKSASAELKDTLSSIQKYEGTLEAARASLDVLQRTGAELKDLIYVYALIARSHTGLSQFDAANEAIDKLLTQLEKNASELSIADERPQYRALAHVFEGSQAASEGKLVEARAHFQRALHETTDESMRWVIEQGLESVSE